MFEFAAVAAFLPAIGWLALIYARDRYEHEPKWLVFRVFAVSAIVGPLLAALIETLITVPLFGTGLIGLILGVALVEELLKLLPVWLLVRRDRNLSEPVDGMVYMAAAGLGFAAVETMLYIAGAGADRGVVAVLRALLTAPMHFVSAGIVGYFFAATVLEGRPATYLLRGLGLAAVFHGSFDYFLFASNLGGGVLVLIAGVAVFVYLFRRALARSPFRTAHITAGLNLPTSPPTPMPIGDGDPAVLTLLHYLPPSSEVEVVNAVGSLPETLAGLRRQFDRGSLLVTYARADHESARLRVQALQQFAAALHAGRATTAEAIRRFAQTTGLQVGEHSFNPSSSLVYVLALISTSQGLKYAAVWAAPGSAWIFSILADTAELRATLIDAFGAVLRKRVTAASPELPTASEVLGTGRAADLQPAPRPAAQAAPSSSPSN
jgi:RsiW-degrading membrane proteinase PrsW (M82 family)